MSLLTLPQSRLRLFLFFFNDTATTEIYTLSLHDALPISVDMIDEFISNWVGPTEQLTPLQLKDRKSTRLNSSHSQISYAVFCLKKKKKKHTGTAVTVTPPVAITHTRRRCGHVAAGCWRAS